MSNKTKPIIVLVFASIFGGLAPGFARFAMEQFTPFSIMILTSLISLIVLLILSGGLKNLYVKKKDLLFLILAMIFWAANSFFFFHGLEGADRTTAVATSTLYLFSPMIVLIISVIMKRLKFTLGKIIGVVIGILGGLTILSQSFADTAQVMIRSIGAFRGNILILSGVLAISFYWLVSDELTKRRNYSALLVTVYSNLGILLLALPFFFKEIGNKGFSFFPLDSRAVIGVLGISLVGGVLTNYLYQWGIKNSSAFTGASVLYISPLSTAVFAFLFLGEELSAVLILSAILIAIGVLFTTILPALKKD